MPKEPDLDDLIATLHDNEFDLTDRVKAGKALLSFEKEPRALACVAEYMLAHCCDADDIVPALLQDLLRHVEEDREQRLEVILSLYHAPALTSNLRVHAIAGLGEFAADNRGVFDILVDEIHRSLWTRRAAIVALGNFGPRAVPILEHVYSRPLADLEDGRGTILATGFPDANWRDLIRTFITQAGLEYVFERYGPDGVALASLLQPDVVYVSWVMLPDLSGWQIVDLCKSSGVRTILLSAATMRSDIARAARHGVDRYILAPPHPKELRQAFIDLSAPDPELMRRLAAKSLKSAKREDH